MKLVKNLTWKAEKTEVQIFNNSKESSSKILQWIGNDSHTT